MNIEIVGSTIKYAFKRAVAEVYEIRGVSMLDVARLKRASDDDTVSASATVQYMTHLYKDAHFDVRGDVARPSRSKPEKLRPRTTFR